MAPFKTFPLTDLTHAYNVPISQLRDYDPECEGCIRSRRNPAKFTMDEAIEIRKALVNYVFTGLYYHFWTSSLNFAGDLPILDRSLAIELNDLAMLTPGFLEFLQFFLRRFWKLWRIVIVNHSPHYVDSIIIYPESIWFDGTEAVGAYRPRLDKLVRRQMARRERKEKPLNEQKSVVEKRLAGLERPMRGRPWCGVVCRFERTAINDGIPYDTYWIVYAGRKH